MKYTRLFLCFAVMVIGFKVYAGLNKAHNFKQDECSLCHLNIENEKTKLKPVTASVCESCHQDRKQKLSHPISIFPRKKIPADMPLVDNKLSCITCHFVHPFSINNKRFSQYLLRRPGRGMVFCSACHQINQKGHIVFEKVHTGTLTVTNPNGTLDDYTLQCIECHDRFIDRTSRTRGAGKWKHFSLKLNHPVGISFKNIALKKPAKFNSPVMLPKEIRLFNGKIGCGTCHNVYSKEKYMLVSDNFKSSLCQQCHKK
ncbi:MAG: cytochrome c3 family protein [Desulfobacula sp.]|nr:cytochrome c3 family protein [Desulfobacula sp.]